jgi:steroid 5-alpha reductase family enzyme
MTTRMMRFAAVSRARSVLVCVAAYCAAGVCALLAGHGFVGAGALLVIAAADLAATLAVFACSFFLDNSSVYDPYWSVAPMAIVAYLAWRSGNLTDPRRVALMCLVAFWALRLTWNWLLRWRGLGDEDWRYADFRPSRAYWVVSLAGFHLFPTVAVYVGCLPMAAVMLLPARHLGIFDGWALLVTCASIVLEMKADKDLRVFRRKRRSAPELLTEGIWSWCRHPNYLGEVMFWWGIGLFGIGAGASWWWSLCGATVITALFLFISIPLMDRHMLKRYPAYTERMKAVPGFFPFRNLPKPRVG